MAWTLIEIGDQSIDIIHLINRFGGAYHRPMFNLLHGLRVIDLTSVVLGPYATQILGDFGADVIKVEPETGDQFRAVRPGLSAEMGAGYINCNRNKRSIAINLKDDAGRDALRKLASTADIIVHNMRPKAAARLGISYEEMRKVNPRIVYCYACGFRSDGPYGDEPAYDDIIQAISGL